MADQTSNGAGAVQSFGQTAQGVDVECVEIGNSVGMRARVITYGASLQSLIMPDGTDVILGFDTLEPYVRAPAYIGAAIGRYANRIANARFELDGRAYELVPSNGPHTLHGGAQGFDKRVWRIAPGRSSDAVSLSYVSADGEEGFPGRLSAQVTYAINSKNELAVTFEATTDQPTIVCMTQHAYFNLAGEGSGQDVREMSLAIAADEITPVDAGLIPTGDFAPVSGTAFDFTSAQLIGARIDAPVEQIARGGGYDHNFVLRKGRTISPEFAARLEDPVSGRAMELYTTEPGLQFYSGNFLNGAVAGKSGKPYVKYSGLCLEPQVFPDAPNQPSFPSARLDPEQVYRHVSVYRFTT